MMSNVFKLRKRSNVYRILEKTLEVQRNLTPLQAIYNTMPQQKTNIEAAIMPFKVLELVEIIMQKKQLEHEDAFAYLYSSNCYQLLLQEDAKLWYMSGLNIFEMLEEEKKSAKLSSSKILLFFSFCLEKYKGFANTSAAEALFIFQKYGVFDYLKGCFEMLHTQGESYILSEIDLFIKTQKK